MWIYALLSGRGFVQQWDEISTVTCFENSCRRLFVCFLFYFGSVVSLCFFSCDLLLVWFWSPVSPCLSCSWWFSPVLPCSSGRRSPCVCLSMWDQWLLVFPLRFQFCSEGLFFCFVPIMFFLTCVVWFLLPSLLFLVSVDFFLFFLNLYGHP